jgi:hypothetical protein
VDSSSNDSGSISGDSSGDSSGGIFSFGSESSSGSSGSSDGNPFGLLVIQYQWYDMPDLDSGTTFLGNTVGFGYGSLADYMTFTGDNRGLGGIEEVTIDLAAAYEAGAIDLLGGAVIVCCADWYPNADDDPDTAPNPNPGTGPAVFTVEYQGVFIASSSIDPGSATPSTTQVATVTVLADGTVERTFP